MNYCLDAVTQSIHQLGSERGVLWIMHYPVAFHSIPSVRIGTR